MACMEPKKFGFLLKEFTATNYLNFESSEIQSVGLTCSFTKHVPHS